ncbi:MAG TPA: transglutaminaseTgpA domain-containing protein [Solirubrobacteraceae bacterium]|nr:transglutaminaseTgpA domain-containing protein [Solirubrobacteraceae bacterium]
MSAAVGHAGGAGPVTAGATRARDAGEGPAWVRLPAFAALCGFCLAHWFGLLAQPPVIREIAIVAAVTLGGLVISQSTRLPAPWAALARWTAAVALLPLTFALAGLDAVLMLPWHWPELADGIGQGLAGLQNVTWPVDPGDDWVTIALVLCAPLAASTAAVLAFWPAREGRGTMRAGALIILLVLYGVAVTSEEYRFEIVRGAALLLLIGAWLWLPRARRAGWPVAAAVLALTAAAAAALGAQVGRGDPWLDHRTWRPFGDAETTSFQWEHRYGPMTWSRTGIELADVRAPRPAFWRVQALERFDGTTWRISPSPASETIDLPPGRNRAWTERIEVEIKALDSELAIGVGSFEAIYGTGGFVQPGPGGSVRLSVEPGEGSTYTSVGYRPRPTSRQLEAAAPPGDPRLLRETRVELPSGPYASEQVTFPLRTGAAYEPGPYARGELASSPYARVGRLAQRLAAGAPSAFEIARRTEAYLEASMSYDERPPGRALPLEAFLMRDRRGYCQHFSGAMALLLRMNGIPARVVSGFAPGERTGKGRYTVRDRDAHSWVEVWFSGIGWVPFDPTPPDSPAAGRQAGVSADLGRSDPGTAADLARGAIGASGALSALDPDKRGDAAGADGSADGAGAGSGDDEGGMPWLAAAVGALVALAAGLAGGLALRRRRRPSGADDPEVAEVLEALRRMGHRADRRTTLLEAERWLERRAGPAAADHVRRLRDRRYAPRSRPPTRASRRALRRALAAGRGPRGAIRAWLAVPPRLRA